MSIQVSHVNIRLSISILVLKLVFLEVISAVIVVIFHQSVLMLSNVNLQDINLPAFNLPVLLGAIFIKFLITIFVIWQWLSEYYEIDSDAIYHRKGVIFKTEERYPLQHIQFIEVQQTVIGKFLNYATISIYDQRRNKYEDMYMIHNPMRYARIIEELLPDSDEKKKLIREHIFERERT